MYQAIITGPAKKDIQAAHDWWASQRSAKQAERWYSGVYQAIRSLEKMPERCSFATERKLLELDIRQLLFGTGRRATHRIVFTIADEKVVVLRVRHAAQGVLSPDELT